jgi:hypothetical protein
MSRTFRPFRLQTPIVVPRLNLVASLGIPPQPLRGEVLHPLRQGSARRLLGFTFPRGGSPRRQTESSSSSYGLVIHLLVLSTSHHWDAVPFGYGVQIPPRRGLPPRWFGALVDAPWRASARWFCASHPAKHPRHGAGVGDSSRSFLHEKHDILSFFLGGPPPAGADPALRA